MMCSSHHAGEAAFLLAAGERLDELARSSDGARGWLDGIELHRASARHAETVKAAGHTARVRAGDFFAFAPTPVYDAAVGNPPYVHYQDFSGTARAAGPAGSATRWCHAHGACLILGCVYRSRGAVPETWRAARLVLPAELLTVNYAAEVRRFLMEHSLRCA